MNILVTSGATKEPVDAVRFITNMSSGQTGALLSNHFQEQGHDVVLLRGLGSAVANERVRNATFVDFADLDQALKHMLKEGHVDVVVHLAAVSDYSVDFVKVGPETHYGPVVGKIDSHETIDIRLKRNFKIVSRLKSYAGAKNSTPFVVAFKLTAEATSAERIAAVEKLYAGGGVDLVVHNDLSEITERHHLFRFVFRDKKTVEIANHEALAAELEKLLAAGMKE